MKAYAKAVGEIARQRGAVFVDLFTPLAARAEGSPRLTDNGLHLNEEGLGVVGALVANQLGAEPKPGFDPCTLQQFIVEKNRLWIDCWRPANWSFVYGDRVTQLFGKPGGEMPSLRVLLRTTRG